ncbi:ABC transporter ATP-binding protein [Metallumcola ferriviriculae]|uniref:ABC transporter ATP-binding protein n=1 Tax=Metallumcola ferriviriculae TaxID=3039180 RepID=A0AAU0UUS9_9FIRM|nr:ABC transporter ATP-binding protein [Desulfitibacteraceae bacterium MK1]
MLKVKNINVAYGDLQVLWDVSLEVKEGEFVALLGANGAGKTTILNTISGLLHPMQGSIEFTGEEISSIPGYRTADLGIAHVPEGRRLFPEMTVRENLEIGSLSKEAKKKRKQTMEEVYQLFPRLKERHKQEAGSLSGGEQQMLAIGRGLMALPKLLMLDEPSLGLAPVIVDQVFEIARDINKKGVTILLVEQNVAHTLQHCNRAYVLENGRVVMKGTGNELLHDEHVKSAYMGI